jgi:hypothetical protein
LLARSAGGKTHSPSGNNFNGKFYAVMQVGIEKDEQGFL